MDSLVAWSALATAIFTGGLVLVALLALGPAKRTLAASERASRAAEEANEQARRDSVEQTRPYVVVELVPGLAGASNFDIRISNMGRSAARELTLTFDAWPDECDDVTQSVKTFFSTPRTLPPGSRHRVMWRLQGNFTDGTKIAGLGADGTVAAHYTSNDPSRPAYEEHFDIMVENSGFWPVAESGPEPTGMTGDAAKFYRLGQALVRRVGELGR